MQFLYVLIFFLIFVFSYLVCILRPNVKTIKWKELHTYVHLQANVNHSSVGIRGYINLFQEINIASMEQSTVPNKPVLSYETWRWEHDRALYLKSHKSATFADVKSPPSGYKFDESWLTKCSTCWDTSPSEDILNISIDKQELFIDDLAIKFAKGIERRNSQPDVKLTSMVHIGTKTKKNNLACVFPYTSMLYEDNKLRFDLTGAVKLFGFRFSK